MSRSLVGSPRFGGPRSPALRRTHGTSVVLLTLLVLVGSAGLFTMFLPGSSTPTAFASTAPTAGIHSSILPPTHGDLVIPSGAQVTIAPPNGTFQNYYQGGNITVQPGGTLIVTHTDLSFVQYVGDVGGVGTRIAHLFRFLDKGTVRFDNSTLTTDTSVLNASVKLFLSVTGSLSVLNSQFKFPGWINVAGSGAVATFNGSLIEANPSVSALVEPAVLAGDTSFAPAILVSGGAEFNLFGSQYLQSYTNNLTLNGTPVSQPVTDSSSFHLPTAGINVTAGSFALPPATTSAELAQDMLYPSEATSVTISFNYDNNLVVTPPRNGVVNGSFTFWYDGHPYPFGNVTFLPGNGLFATAVAGPASPLVAAMYQDGTPLYTAGGVQFTAASSPNVTIDSISLSMTPATKYDLAATGAGTRFNVVNSALDLNWALATFPWTSNKLVVSDGATAYLANLAITQSIASVFSTSAILPDAASQVFFYRWAEFNLTGRTSVLPVQGAHVTPFYSLDANQQNNQTANALNNVAATSPAIWGYVQYWDTFFGIPSYGSSNALGQAYVLLAAGNLTGPTLPDGYFLGGYHIGISVPSTLVASVWFHWAVSPYPLGVANGTAGYAGPDFGPAQQFAGYYGAATVASVSVLANGVANSTVSIGQTLGVRVVVNDVGTATITQVGASLYYNSSLLPNSLVATFAATNLHLTAPGQQTTFTLNWTVVDKVTGLNGWFKHNLTVVVVWNYNIPSLAGGNLSHTASVNITPSQIRLSSLTLPPTTLDPAQTYFTSGTLAYNGSQPAAVDIFATPVGGGTQVFIGSTAAVSGTFTITWGSIANLVPGTSYQLTVKATYNGRSTNDTLAGTYGVPAPSSSPTNFLLQKFLGLPLWVWIAIASAAVVAIVLFLFFARRQAAGKLVECGECGNLIPEDATVCPKCGAEFESDLIRCSRCASTIPADSKFCPECAAQLLGTPGEAESDPEKQAYADFTEKYRAEAKRELGDNYSEGAFWDWWKRQPTYTPFSQWSLQQGQGTARVGMTAPPTGTQTTPEADAGRMPPKGGAGAAEAAGAALPPATPTTTVPPPAPGAAGLKACPSCGKEIPVEYLVCPFCNAVTQ